MALTAEQKSDLMRTVRFSPYRKGMGPTFTLRLYSTNDAPWGSSGHVRVGYELIQYVNGKSTVIFSGDDFGCPPISAEDSDDTVKNLMGFLTLRRGDTDAEYFANYTAEQTEFSETHAEYLALEVFDRFGE